MRWLTLCISMGENPTDIDPSQPLSRELWSNYNRQIPGFALTLTLKFCRNADRRRNGAISSQTPSCRGQDCLEQIAPSPRDGRYE